jgi:hypothetical protein
MRDELAGVPAARLWRLERKTIAENIDTDPSRSFDQP